MHRQRHNLVKFENSKDKKYGNIQGWGIMGGVEKVVKKIIKYQDCLIRLPKHNTTCQKVIVPIKSSEAQLFWK